MKIIGLTQRVEVVHGSNERRDCLDQKWGKFISSLGFIPLPIPNSLGDISRFITNYNFSGVVLTGGNDLSTLPQADRTAPERDRTESILIDFCIEKRLPLIGVCRGMQMLTAYFGGRLVPVAKHVNLHHGLKISSNINYDFLPKDPVNSFHRWGIDDRYLPDELVILAYSSDGFVEAFHHNDLPIFGIMWHPERNQPFRSADIKLFTNVF